MLRIQKKHADEMVAHAREEDPNECCGILGGKHESVSRIYRIANTARSPYRYLMDPARAAQRHARSGAQWL